MIEFHQLVSVKFQGIVIVFGRPVATGNTDIYFNVLGLDVSNADDRLDWTGFTKLDFPKEVRQVGMSLITVQRDDATMVPSVEQFRVVTDQRYISVVQQSIKGTLYINRFRLLKSQSGTNQKQTTYSLSPAWEVRYSRSHKMEVPADKSDTQDYLDPDGVPFLEPSLELSMVDTVQNGAFDVILLPITGSAVFAWQFLVHNQSSTELNFYNFPASENGLIDIVGKTIGSNNQILPDSSCSFAITGSNQAFPLQGAPRAVVYVKHEKVVQPDGTSIGVKRASRVALTQTVLKDTTAVTATIDSAIGIKGTMARLSGIITCADIQPAVFDLLFDGVSHLQLNAPSSGDNPLAIKGPYSISFLLAPATTGDGVLLFGGTETDEPNKAAPFVRIIDGDKLEVGFGNGTTAVTCRTLHQVLFQNVWTVVNINYAGAGNNPFTITINETIVPLTACITATEPSGSPMTRIGATADGFIGELTQVNIKVGTTNIVTLPCNTVDYAMNPPTTPNIADSGIIVSVSGARMEPSTAPVNVDMSGTFHIDEMGLTYYSGIASFIQPKAATCLLDGSDGLLHLYYQGKNNLLSVAQFSTGSARVTFAADWSTNWGLQSMSEPDVEGGFRSARYLGWPAHEWHRVADSVLEAPDKTQAGFLNFVAHRVGTYMNGTRIIIASSTVSPLLCDITVVAPDQVGTETWKGLPRDIGQMSMIWNGAGNNSPDAQEVLSQRQPYFDYNGTVPMVLAPSAGGNNGSYFIFTSVYHMSVPLASVTISAGSTAEFVKIDIESSAPANWQHGETLKQSWPEVPAKSRSILDVLAGKATHYEYARVTTDGTRSYGLPVTVSRSDDQVIHVVFFVRNELLDFSISVADGATPKTCNVTINGISLPEVSRVQDEFALTLNGQDTKYSYPPGYLTTIANKIFAQTNGLSGDVVNTNEPTPGGAFAYAGLVRVLYMGADYDATRIAVLGKTTALAFQSASLTFNGRTDFIRGSMLFGAIVVDQPTGGGVGKLSNTSSYSGGVAPVITPGVNGGWIPVSPKFGLAFNLAGKTNYVRFNVDKAYSQANNLAIASDLTISAWLKQESSKANTLSRVLNYNVAGNLDYPDLSLQYMIGSRRGPGLIIGSSTFVTKAFNFMPPNLTVQVYVKLSAASASGKVLSVGQVRGSTEFLSLSIDSSSTPVANFLQGAASVVSTSPMPLDVWVCLTATITDAGGGKATISLYVDGGSPVTATGTNSFTGSLGALTVGSSTGMGISFATLNGIAFWQRALSSVEVTNSFLYGFPDNDSLLGIRWNFAEGTGTTIMNSAATGNEYDAEVVNPVNPSWDTKGAFDVPYAGRNDLIIASNRILKGWTQVALASRQGYGLKLNGATFGKVQDGSSFNPSQSFAVEAWISPTSLNSKQVIAEKPGSYSLYINTLGQVCLKVTVQQDSSDYAIPPYVFSYEIKTGVEAGKPSYVAVNFTTGSNHNETGADKYVIPKYYVYSSLYINGKKAVTNNKSDYPTSVSITNEESSFYLGVAEDNTFQFIGLVSHVRVWSRTLTDTEIGQTYALRRTPTSLDGLTASWDFDENSGTVAKDLTGNNDMQLSSNQLWTIWQDVAQANIYVNGGHSLPSRLNLSQEDGYLDNQFTIGGALQGSTLKLPFSGEIDDVRLFKTRLTEQQVRESMNKALTGIEDHLAAYWRIDAGSGPTLLDVTGKGNNGTLLPISSPPKWQSSSAPIQNEGQSVVNIIGGNPDYLVATIQGQPAVIEYASTEKDAYGDIFSVIKRGYFFRTLNGSTSLEVGYKIGDLDTIYVGQVQSKPSVVGFIEGGPPIPSENQTLAYWSGSNGGPAAAYATASSVTYEESETKSWSFSASQSSTFNGTFNIKGGFYQESKSEVSVGLGAEAQTQMLKTKVKLGLKSTLSGDLGGTDSVAQSHSSSVSLSNTMKPSGTWEAANKILNPTVGRRYIQNNIGIAVVKSSTADLFMQALKGTQTPVGYTIVPNETIPIDTNIIEFPINPKYIKNGTLDGKVGLMNDPDYPNANDERGSYFKPLDAYATKRKIEKQEQQLKAYFDQFEVNKYRLVGSLERVKDKLREAAGYDFSNKKNLRSIFCNYVWTAAGGLHKEEHSIANTYSETYVGASSLKFAAGFEVGADIGTLFGGYYIEADVMLGNTWTMTASKAESTSNGFRLLCTVVPTDFLAPPIITTDGSGQLVFQGYGCSPAPGKVDAYRYMSFLLAPSKDNFTALRQVVDRNWLNNSTAAAANAMREAMTTDAEPWRVLYRTTYVSRVPAPFQPVKDDTTAPNIMPPADLSSNFWLMKIIDDKIGKTNPTPLEIGTAIDAVLGSSSTGAGILKDIIPWWAGFYLKAQVYGSDEFKELANLRIDLLNYMVSKYEAENYMLS